VVLHCGPGRGFGHGNRLTKSATTVVATSPYLDTTINSGVYTYSNGTPPNSKTAKNTAGTTNRLVASVATKSTGKWYFEATIDVLADGVGIGDASANTASFAGADTHSIGYQATGTIFYNGSSAGSSSTYTTGDRIAVAFDADAKKAWVGKISAGVITWQGTSNPATNTGGFTMTSATGPFRAIGQCNALNDQMTVCLSAADQTATPPSGFSTWA
jgi:hypothetical protein